VTQLLEPVTFSILIQLQVSTSRGGLECPNGQGKKSKAAPYGCNCYKFPHRVLAKVTYGSLRQMIIRKSNFKLDMKGKVSFSKFNYF